MEQLIALLKEHNDFIADVSLYVECKRWRLSQNEKSEDLLKITESIDRQKTILSKLQWQMDRLLCIKKTREAIPLDKNDPPEIKRISYY